MIKVLVVTLPQREAPTNNPPLGAMSVIHYARKHSGEDVQIELFNIDALRPSYGEILEHIREFQPDILGISAVVSTGYAYTKKLSLDIKKILPDTLVVLGGNLGASAEILLRKTGVDLCVLGEGEKIFLNVINQTKTSRRLSDFKGIPGLVFLDEERQLVNTGYEASLAPDEIWDVDWADLEKDGSIYIYFPKFRISDLVGESVFQDAIRVDKVRSGDVREGGLVTAKGCVSRCTFCHRWDKGIRHIPVDSVIERMNVLIKKYNVGVFHMLAECFGSDKRWLGEFLEKIGPYNVLWTAGGVRTSVMDQDWIRRMKEAGCYYIQYGNETGSSQMLEVMEKKVSLEDNYNAVAWTIEAGLGNATQLVIGMPGESPETIKETIAYVNFCTTRSPLQDPRQVSINFAQALPGTPLYEFGRTQGLIGNTIDAEEQYLLGISDRNASDPMTCINFTNYPRLTLLSWQLLIRFEANYHYTKKFGKAHYCSILLRESFLSQLPEWGIQILKEKGYPTIGLFFKLLRRGKLSALMDCYPTLFYRMRRFAGLFKLINILTRYGVKACWTVCKDYAKYHLGLFRSPWKYQYRSLRKIVDQDIPPIKTDCVEMIPLRKGR